MKSFFGKCTKSLNNILVYSIILCVAAPQSVSAAYLTLPLEYVSVDVSKIEDLSKDTEQAGKETDAENKLKHFINALQGIMPFAPSVPQEGIEEMQPLDINAGGKLPSLIGFDNEELTLAVNERVAIIAEEQLAAARDSGAETIEFDFTLDYPDAGEKNPVKNFITIMIVGMIELKGKTEPDTGKPLTKTCVSSINVDLDNENIFYLDDILGVNGVQLANKQTEAEIIKNPSHFLTDSVYTVTNEQCFGISGGKIILLFDELTIAPLTEGIVRIEIDPGKIINHTINKLDYYTKDSYNLKMLPARSICEYFGYTVNWIQATRSAEISKGTFLASFPIEKNSYTKGRQAAKQLESQPEIRGASTYVPISFFTEILDLVYSVDSLGRLTLSAYQS